jgi:hypothetical protein
MNVSRPWALGDEDDTSLQNVGKHLASVAMSYPRRPESWGADTLYAAVYTYVWLGAHYEHEMIFPTGTFITAANTPFLSCRFASHFVFIVDCLVIDSLHRILVDVL